MYLRLLGAGPDVMIPLMVERSVEMMVGIYGVMKAAAVHMPVEPDLPVDRV